MSKAGFSLVIIAVAVLSAAAFEIFATDVIRPALAADASNGSVPCGRRQSAAG